MASEKLFGNRIKPACAYCDKAFRQTESGILCFDKGVVPPDYSCKKYKYDPTKRVPKRPLPLEKYKQSDFAV